MAREMTPQERAAIQSFYYRLHAGVEGGEFHERYEQEDIGRIIELLDETRRAALLEAAEKARERSKRQRNDCESRTTHMLRTDEAELIAYALDRLAQEG